MGRESCNNEGWVKGSGGTGGVNATYGSVALSKVLKKLGKIKA